MRVHHLNAISTCPLGGKLMDGRTESILRRGHLACHCVLVEMPTQLVLIDTGLGLRDVAEPHERLSKFFLFLVKPEFREEMTAVRQIQRLGYDPKDVRHIVLSHLDFDHAGGLDDFPHALVHLLDEEEHAATEQRTVLDRMRYRPAQWSSRDRWRMYEASGEAWHGFPAVRDLEGVGPDILMVPLIGHTLGHAGIAVRTDRGWLLDAGDAYFYHREMDTEPYCTPGLRLYQWMMQKDGAQRLGNQRRLRELVHSAADVTVFCSHDLDEMERLSGRSVELPAEAFFARRDVATATTSSSA